MICVSFLKHFFIFFLNFFDFFGLGARRRDFFFHDLFWVKERGGAALFVAHVLFFGPWTSLRGTPHAQDHPVRDPALCCVSLLCCGVVWCVGAVCVQNFLGCVQNLGVPDSPPPDPLRRTAQNFALFFHFPPLFSLFFSLWGSSRGILVVFEASVPIVHVRAHGLSCATPVVFAKCQEQFYN